MVFLLAVKLAYTAFMAVLVPVYLRNYGPTNFLYFCDLALFLTLAGLWLDDPLLLSIAATGILIPQVYWLLDFIVRLVGGRASGMTDYMFDTRRSLLLRGLSLFHGWLPLLLVGLLLRSGYDPRALPIWTALSTVLVLICYFLIPPPSPEHGVKPVNINYVYGLSDTVPQQWMPAWAWLLVALIGYPLILYVPAHLLLLHFMPVAAR
ncbi:MAG: hypothetical protein ACHQIO_02525 [Nevskiales bacterium]